MISVQTREFSLIGEDGKGYRAIASRYGTPGHVTTRLEDGRMLSFVSQGNYRIVDTDKILHSTTH